MDELCADFRFEAESAETEENFKRYVSRLSVSGGAFLTRNLSGEMYAIYRGDTRIGFLAARGGVLGGFFVAGEHYALAENAFSAALKKLDISCAHVLTGDSPLISLCCTRWTSTSVMGLCYEYSGGGEDTDIVLGCASERDRAALENSGFFRADTLEALMKRHAVYVKRESGTVAAFGAVERSENEPYGFVGVGVREDRRMCGIGKSILSRLARMLADYGAIALSQCDYRDRATAHALESAGYVCFDKLLKVEF